MFCSVLSMTFIFKIYILPSYVKIWKVPDVGFPNIVAAVETQCSMHVSNKQPFRCLYLCWLCCNWCNSCNLQAVFIRSSEASLGLKAFSYYLILFPSLDVISAYPLITHTVVNNFYILITGHDTSEKPKYRFDLLLRLFLRFVVALIPIMAAFGVANLIYVLKYTGLVGFMCFLFPFSLQVRSIQVCKKTFSKVLVSVTGSSSPANGEEEKKGLISPKLVEQTSSLFTKDVCRDKGPLYMTPYSYKFISRPISVACVGVAGGLLFVLALSSLFVHPDRLTCDVLENI